MEVWYSIPCNMSPSAVVRSIKSVHGRLPPVGTLPGDEVKADKAPHGVCNQHSWPAVIHLDCTLNQLPHPVEMTRLHTMTVSSSALAYDTMFLVRTAGMCNAPYWWFLQYCVCLFCNILRHQTLHQSQNVSTTKKLIVAVYCQAYFRTLSQAEAQSVGAP